MSFHIVAFLAALVTVIIAWAIGDFFIPKCRFRDYVAIAFGTSAIVAILFLLNLLNIFTKPVILILLALGLGLAIIRIWFCWKGGWRWTSWRKNISKPDWLEILAIIGIVGFALLNLLGASSPSIDADGLAYHLLVPKLWLEHDGFVTLSTNMYAAWPLNFDQFYEIGLVFGSQFYGKFLHALFGLLAVALTISAASALFSRRTGLLAGLMVITLPAVGVLSGTAYVDLFVLYLGLVLFLMMVPEQDTKQRQSAMNKLNTRLWPFYTGIIAGAIVGSKIVGFGFAVPFFLFFLWRTWSQGRKWMEVPLFVAGACVLSAPWLVKSWLTLGNPIWPFAYSIFGGHYWSSEAARAISTEVAAGIPRNIFTFITFPAQLTFRSVSTGEMGFIGAGFLAFGAIAVWMWLRSRPLKSYNKKLGKKTLARDERGKFTKAVLIFTALNLIFFFFLLHQMRYIIFLLPLWAILAMSVLEIKWEPKWVGTVFTVLLLLTIAFNAPFSLAYNGKSLGVSLGLESEQEYLARNCGPCPAMEWMNEELSDARVFSYASGTFYLDHDHAWGIEGRQGLIDYSEITTGEALLGKLRAEGFTHLFAPAELQRPVAAADLIASCDRVYEDRYIVCELDYSPP